MISYSDTVIGNGETPNFYIYSHKFNYLKGAKISLYLNDKCILTDTFDSQHKDFILDDCNGDYIGLRLEIQGKKSIHTIPVTIMRLDEKTPYIICDIDFTISATSVFGYITNNLLHMKMILNSSVILKELAKHYKIIYLTGRNHCYTKLTKLWIKKNNFPEGPMLSRKNETSFQLRQFKVRALDKIVGINPNGIGIGDLKSDIEAYLHHNLTAIKIIHPIISKKNNRYYKISDKYYKVKSWLGIEKLFHEVFIKKGDK